MKHKCLNSSNQAAMALLPSSLTGDLRHTWSGQVQPHLVILIPGEGDIKLG